MDEEILGTKPLSRRRRDARFSNFAHAQTESAHVPVLLHEVIEYLDLHPDDFIIDGTIDGGGHSEKILEKLSPKGRLLGVEWDEEMLGRLKQKPAFQGKNVMLARGNYATLPDILEDKKMGKADALLLDLGFSSEQLEAHRGFSFAAHGEEPLTMTYSSDESSVAEILRALSEEDLANIIWSLGGERFSRRIAKAVKVAGRKKKITTSGELSEIIVHALPRGYERGRIHPATRTFQALRIYANKELENLETILKELPRALRPGGRIVVISFHSLEDRLIKNQFRTMEKNEEFKIITKKPVEASLAEIRVNPRSRSAKLRAGIIL